MLTVCLVRLLTFVRTHPEIVAGVLHHTRPHFHPNEHIFPPYERANLDTANFTAHSTGWNAIVPGYEHLDFTWHPVDEASITMDL